MRTIIATIAATLAVVAVAAASGVGLSSSNVPRSVDSASVFDLINIDSPGRPDNFRHGLSSQIKWPQYYDGLPQFSEWTGESKWTRDYIKVPARRRRQCVQDQPVAALLRENSPMHIEFAPAGALYSLEYGEGLFVENEDAQVAGIDFGESQEFFVAAGPHLWGVHNYQDTNRHTSADTRLTLPSANGAWVAAPADEGGVFLKASNSVSHEFQLAA
jgi:hypothetical protein